MADPKLPSAPNRRDLLVGVAAGVAATALPGALQGAARPAPSESPALTADAEAIANAITGAWNRWLVTASFDGGAIRASTLEGGSLSSPVDVVALIEGALVDDGVEAEGAALVAEASGAAWTEWAVGWELPASEAFPAFTAVAAPEAPETEAEPVALRPGQSAGWPSIQRGLAGRLNAALAGKDPIKGDHRISTLVHSVAWRVGQRLSDWSAEAMVEGIRGGGPVPTFAPPYVPVGPVVAGDNIATPGHLLQITPIPGGPPLVVIDDHKDDPLPETGE